MNDSGISRRHLLAGVGISTTAGCLSQLPLLSENGIRLGSLGIYNRTDESWTISIRLERTGSVVYENTHEVTPENEPVIVPPDWSSEPAEYTLLFHVNGEIQKHELTVEDDKSSDESCTLLQIMLDRRGHGPILRDSNEAPWGSCNYDTE